jgi:hypothetical protein
MTFSKNINIFVWKECLNSDGQRFHQYQQKNNHHSSQTMEHKNKTHTPYVAGNQDPGLEQAQKCDGVFVI